MCVEMGSWEGVRTLTPQSSPSSAGSLLGLGLPMERWGVDFFPQGGMVVVVVVVDLGLESKGCCGALWWSVR